MSVSPEPETEGAFALALRVDEASARALLVVSGTVVSTSTREGGGPIFEAVLDDGTGTVVLSFLGRRDVAGLEVGALVTVEGTVLDEGGRLRVINPRYRFGS